MYNAYVSMPYRQVWLDIYRDGDIIIIPIITRCCLPIIDQLIKMDS